MIRRFRTFVKNALPQGISFSVREFLSLKHRVSAMEQNVQNLMILQSGSRLTAKEALRAREFKVYSQNGEDGILQYIFSRIGTTNKKCVEFGIEDGRECNTAHLIANHGWSALLMDGDKKFVSDARYWYGRRLGVSPQRARVIQCFVTQENINHVLKGQGFAGEIDLLSVDIDGNDYHIWNAVTVAKPRVVIVEYNAAFGLEPLTVPYDPGFDRYEKHQSGMYHGASLAALSKLAEKKGYVLVGCDSSGVNAFFVRKDVAIKAKLKTFSPQEAYYPHSRRSKQLSTEEQFHIISHLPFERVS